MEGPPFRVHLPPLAQPLQQNQDLTPLNQHSPAPPSPDRTDHGFEALLSGADELLVELDSQGTQAATAALRVHVLQAMLVLPRRVPLPVALRAQAGSEPALPGDTAGSPSKRVSPVHP